MKAVGAPPQLTAAVAETLRTAILTGELRTGELYSVSGLAGHLGVSRTPIREAVLGLVDAGLVTVQRNRGFRVVRPSADRIADIFAVRLLLEVPAAGAAAGPADRTLIRGLNAELAAMRAASRAKDEPAFVLADRAFHDLVLTAAGNAVLASVVAGLRAGIVSLGVSTAGRSRSLRAIADEHVPIRAALAAGDAAAAERAMREHLTRTRDLMIAQARSQFDRGAGVRGPG